MPFEWTVLALERLAGIEPYEALQVLRSKRRRPVPKVHPSGMRVLEIWGRTEAGRGLVVVTRRLPGPGFDWQILEVREMTAAEAVAYDEWEARRG